MSDQDLQEEEFNPLYRVIGAVVLVALAVVFVPVILDENELPSGQQVQGSLETSEQDRVVVTSLNEIKGRHEQPDQAVNKKAVGKNADPKLAKVLDKVRKQAPVAEKTAVREESSTTPVTGTKSQVKSSDLRQGWIVQLGTYKNKQNATRLKKRLAAHGYEVKLEGVKIREGQAVRVRVGPFEEKVTATNMLARINRDLGVNGVVLSLQ